MAKETYIDEKLTNEVQAEVVRELDILHDFNRVVRSQIANLASDTEEGAQGIVVHLAGIQQKIEGLTASIAQQQETTQNLFDKLKADIDAFKQYQFDPSQQSQFEQLKEDTVCLFVKIRHYLERNQCKLINHINLTNHAVVEEINQIYGLMQYQDMTRQQSEHIIHSIERLDEHIRDLKLILIDPEAKQSIKSMAEHMKEIFDSYVMEKQRHIHQTALERSHHHDKTDHTQFPSTHSSQDSNDMPSTQNNTPRDDSAGTTFIQFF